MFKTIRKGFNLSHLGYDDKRTVIGEDRFLWFQRTQAQQSTIVKLATNESIINGQVKDAVRVITEAAAQTLGVGRASIWLLSEDGKELCCIDQYENISDHHYDGMVLSAADYPRYFRALKTGRAVDAHDAGGDPRTSEFYEDFLYPHGITSLLDAAIRVSGKIVGVVRHEHTGRARTWLTDETNFAGEIADQVANVLINHKRKEAERALQKAHAELEKRVVERTTELVEEIAVRKKAEQLLSKSEQRYRALVENAPVCIHEIDLSGRLLAVNPRGLDMIGQDNKAVGLPFIDLIAPEDRKRVGLFLEEAINGRFSEFEFKRIDDGETHVYASNFIPLKGPDGQLEKIMGYTEDITARKLTEAKDKLLQVQLLHTEKLSSIGLLAAGVAHELNSPLTGLLSLLRTYRKRAAAKSETYEEVTEMLEAAEHMAKIVEDLNQFSRLSKDRFMELDIGDVIESTLSFSEHQFRHKKIKVIKEYEEGVSKIYGNKSQLQQVIINLLTNAIDAMPHGGQFTIHAFDLKDEHKICLEFIDTGFGIKPEDLPRIFDPFFTTKMKDKGTGLGLSVSHGIIKSHKGKFFVESQVGEGAKFTVKLPMVK